MVTLAWNAKRRRWEIHRGKVLLMESAVAPRFKMISWAEYWGGGVFKLTADKRIYVRAKPAKQHIHDYNPEEAEPQEFNLEKAAEADTDTTNLVSDPDMLTFVPG